MRLIIEMSLTMARSDGPHLLIDLQQKSRHRRADLTVTIARLTIDEAPDKLHVQSIDLARRSFPYLEPTLCSMQQISGDCLQNALLKMLGPIGHS
jgi:hypothetical protein